MKTKWPGVVKWISADYEFADRWGLRQFGVLQLKEIM